MPGRRVDSVEMNTNERLKLLEEHRQNQLRTIQRYESLPENSVYRRNKAAFKRFMDILHADLQTIEHSIMMAEAGKGA
jgi:hypothetical protein